MSLSLKDGVKFDVDSLALGRILGAILMLSHTWPIEIVLTAGSDGEHMVHSRHYRGEAVDVRTSNQTDHEAFQKALQAALGDQFGVSKESDHLHVQVKIGTTYATSKAHLPTRA